METYIEVLGPDALEKAKAIASYYNTKYVVIDSSNVQVISNKELEKDLCYDDDTCAESLEKISNCYNITIVPDDLSF